MRILAKGNSKRSEEFKQKLSLLDFEVNYIDENTTFILNDDNFDAIFDLNFDDNDQSSFLDYGNLRNTPVFISAVKNSLAQMVFEKNANIQFPLFGINSIETFLNRNLLEVSMLNASNEQLLIATLGKLNWEYKLVKDRVGMVTPRVVCMLINEACYTLQEGTASMADIDISMKLGTNYPFGPFEWADKIGIKNVYEILENLYNDTKDERYKICPLLKTHYLLKQNFNF
jgi:3-hydroxybutyryl-CoA dehydrogenase